MAKLTTTDITNFQNEQTAAGSINNNNTAIKLAMENTLSRDGTSPNQMTAQLDMNSNRIINLAAPQGNGDPLRFGDVSLAGIVTYTAGTGITINGTVISSTGGGGTSGDDSLFTIFNHADNTKIAAFSAAGITTATTRTFTFPDASTTFVGTATTQTLTNKSIDAGQLTGTVISARLTGSYTGVTGLGTITVGVWNGTAVDVAHGGTGAATFTAYSVICAGTTSTGVFQNVSGVGTSGQVLTSNGAAALPTWQPASGGRTVLAADRSYFIRTDGSDSNTGLANTSGAAFLTIQKAFNVISSTLDLANFIVTINIADGTYTGAIAATSWVGGGSIVVAGNSGTPANVLISTTSNSCFSISIPLPGSLTIKDMKLTTATSGSCIDVLAGAVVKFTNVEFGTCATYHLNAAAPGATIVCTGNYKIVGNAQYHMLIGAASLIQIQGKTITVTGTPAFSGAFVLASTVGATYADSNTYSGAATGTRYSAQLNGVIFTNSAGANYFPGNVAGSVVSGGVYS